MSGPPNHGDASGGPWWLYYALGGGTGHLMRAIALARRAARHGVRTRILCNSFRAAAIVEHFQACYPCSSRWIEFVRIAAAAERGTIATRVANELQSRPAPEWLIVDTFPRGLAGELRELLPASRLPAALVHRDLAPEYLAWAKLGDFVRRYDVVFAPGELGPLALAAGERLLATEPWLVCDAEELLAPSAARAALIGRPTPLNDGTGHRVPSLPWPADSRGDRLRLQALNSETLSDDQGEPLVVVSGSGRTEEALAAGRWAASMTGRFERTMVRFVSLDAPALAVAGTIGQRCWPLLRYLRGIDLLVGAGGYHTVHESRAAGVPLIAVPQPRQYDRQSNRLRAEEAAERWENAEQRLAAWLAVFPCDLPARGRLSRETSRDVAPDDEVKRFSGADAAASHLVRLAKELLPPVDSPSSAASSSPRSGGSM